MTTSTYFVLGSAVYMRDGPWDAKLTQAQTDQLLAIFDEAGAVQWFNRLYEACEIAGYIPWGSPKENVISFGTAKLRRQLEASVASLEDAR